MGEVDGEGRCGRWSFIQGHIGAIGSLSVEVEISMYVWFAAA